MPQALGMISGMRDKNVAAAELGRKGGHSRSEAKVAAARRNLKKAKKAKEAKSKTKSIALLPCLMMLLSVPVSAQTRIENVFNVGATTFDMITTARFVKNGHCIELNLYIPREQSRWGPQDHRTAFEALTIRRSDPSTATLIAHGAYRALSTYVVQRGLREISKRSNNRVARTLTKHLSVGYGLSINAESAYLGFRNLKRCGW